MVLMGATKAVLSVVPINYQAVQSVQPGYYVPPQPILHFTPPIEQFAPAQPIQIKVPSKQVEVKIPFNPHYTIE